MKLYLGITPNYYPYVEELLIEKKMREIDAGIIFSYWVFRKHKEEIYKKGIHDFFMFDGPIMVDSGAYSAWNSKVHLNHQEYSVFLNELKAREGDIFVNLDVIGDKFGSFSNFLDLKRDLNYLKIPILPVFHYPSLDHHYAYEPYIGMGGMVRALKINETGSIYDLVEWIPKFDIRQKYHGFGVGSPYNQIIFEDFLHSVDWMGWRRNAAICSVYTPEGSRTVQEARRKPKGKSMTPALFREYKPDFIDSYDLLHKKGTEGWNWRALWNVWQFLVAQEHKDQINKSDYVKRLKKMINRPVNNKLDNYIRGV